MRIIRKIKFALKISLLKSFNKNIFFGTNVKIDFNTRIYSNSNKIVIGNNVYLRSKEKGYQAGMPFPTTLLIDKKGGVIHVGESCRINGAYIHAQKSIIIGKNCVIASGVNILDTNGHELYSDNRTKNRDEAQPVTIGDNVWLGLNAVILKGTIIGNNSVVSAGSVVRGTFPENSLIVGNPAKVVKTLDINSTQL